ARTIFVLLDHRAVQADSREQATGARIGQHLGSHLPISVALGVTAYRPCRHRGVRAKSEFAREEMLHALLIHDQHDQVHGLAADLKTDAAASDDKKCWSAPSLCRTAARQSPAIFRANNKAAL